MDPSTPDSKHLSTYTLERILVGESSVDEDEYAHLRACEQCQERYDVMAAEAEELTRDDIVAAGMARLLSGAPAPTHHAPAESRETWWNRWKRRWQIWAPATVALATAVLLLVWRTGVEPETPERICPFPDEDPSVRVMQWTMGCDRAREATLRKGHVALSVFELSEALELAAETPLVEHCIDGSSLLLTPDRGTAYVSDSDRLYMIDLGQPRLTHVPVPIVADLGDWRIEQLLAFRRAATPAQMLVAMVREQPGGARDHSLWRFDLRDREVHGEPFRQTSKYELSGPEAFARDYFVPRCREGYRDCLILRDTPGGHGLGYTELRGQPVTTLAGAQAFRVFDAVWSDPVRRHIMVLRARDCTSP